MTQKTVRETGGLEQRPPPHLDEERLRMLDVNDLSINDLRNAREILIQSPHCSAFFTLRAVEGTLREIYKEYDPNYDPIKEFISWLSLIDILFEINIIPQEPTSLLRYLNNERNIIVHPDPRADMDCEKTKDIIREAFSFIRFVPSLRKLARLKRPKSFRGLPNYWKREIKKLIEQYKKKELQKSLLQDFCEKRCPAHDKCKRHRCPVIKTLA